jgi:hypothetical protein
VDDRLATMGAPLMAAGRYGEGNERWWVPVSRKGRCGAESRWVTLHRWVAGRRADGGGNRPECMVAAWARAGGRGSGGVGLGGPQHSVGPKRLVGQNATEG